MISCTKRKKELKWGKIDHLEQIEKHENGSFRSFMLSPYKWR